MSADNSFNKQRILDSINKHTNVTISKEDFDEEFDIATPELLYTNPRKKNTKLQIVPKELSSYYGIRTVHYNRIHKNALGLIEVTRTNELTVSELLQQINNNYNLFLTPYDVVDYPLDDVQSGTFILPLEITNTSLMFYEGRPSPYNDQPVRDLIYPKDTLITSYCVGKEKYGMFSDGLGGTYERFLAYSSNFCDSSLLKTSYLVLFGGDSNEIYDTWQVAGTGGSSMRI